MNLLFVCTANEQRSPTAEFLFSSKHNAKSCGTSPLSENPINSVSIKWADKIFVMEQHHKNFLLENFPESKEKGIVVLNIPDIYYKNEPDLIKLLKEKVTPHLD